MTKNAIIGHLDRMGVAKEPSPIKRGMPPRPAVPKRVGKAPTLPTLEQPGQRGIRPVPKLAQLLPAPMPSAPIIVPAKVTPSGRSTLCCWPIGDPGTEAFRWCEAPAAAGRSYCAAHHRVAYVRVRPLREEAA